MKVAHVITRLIIGGAQENTLYTIQDLVQEYGDEVLLLTGPPKGPEGSLLSWAKRTGATVIVIDELEREIHPIHDLCAGWKLRQLFRQHHPDLIHTHTSKAGILGRWAAASLRIPVVHTVHGASFHVGQSNLSYRIYRWLERITAHVTDHFISVADAMTLEYVRARVAPPERFTTIYSGFEVTPFLQPSPHREYLRDQWNVTPQHFVVGKIARLFHLKGHHDVIRAAQQVFPVNPWVRFVFVGDGILLDSLKSQIKELGLSEAFIFTGLISPEDIPHYLAAMDLIVHTSYWEGLARVLPQALIAGKPVISYDVGGASEVVLPNVTGYLVPVGDIRSLADKILLLSQNPEQCHQMGQAGRSRFTAQFQHQTMTKQIRQIYEQVLNQRSARGHMRDKVTRPSMDEKA